MLHEDNSCDDSSDANMAISEVYTNVDNENVKTPKFDNRLSDCSVPQCQSTEFPTRPKSGNSFSIKYLLGLDKSSSTSTSGHQLDDNPKTSRELPTEPTKNCA